jgi:hypothetical protein
MQVQGVGEKRKFSSICCSYGYETVRIRVEYNFKSVISFGFSLNQSKHSTCRRY